jgi:hypothetical protein
VVDFLQRFSEIRLAALPAIVRAARQMDGTSSGKVLNSFSAALVQETGRVSRTSGISDRYDPYVPYIVIFDNRLQMLGASGRVLAKTRTIRALLSCS